MSRYRVTCWPVAPVDITVEAEDEDDAIDAALDTLDAQAFLVDASFEAVKVADERA